MRWHSVALLVIVLLMGAGKQESRREKGDLEELQPTFRETSSGISKQFTRQRGRHR